MLEIEKRFEGKVAFVTGAATGIGQAAAVASIIAFRLSDDASYLTCTTVLADPGFIVNAEL